MRGGQKVTISGAGWYGDRQVDIAFGGETKTVDVIDGKVSASFTAPNKTTAVKVVVTGVQSEVHKNSVVAVKK